MPENSEEVIKRAKKERAEEEARIGYLYALQELKDYYNCCQRTGEIPEKGLQKVLYDLGKKVIEGNLTERENSQKK